MAAPDLQPRWIDVATWDTKDVIFVWDLEIANSGAPSVIKDWTMKVRTYDNHILTAQTVRNMLDSTNFNSDGTVNRAYPKQDQIIERTQYSAIPNGGNVSGFIMFQLHGVTPQYVSLPGTKYEITFRDVRGKLYSLETYPPSPKKEP